MKEEILTFLLEEEETFHEISSEKVLRLLDNANVKAFSELGGRMLRLAIVRIQHDNGRPRKVRAIEFRRCQLRPNGSLDPKFKERRKKLSAELASIQTREHGSPKVVDASRRFKERRFHNEFSWTPTVSMVQQLSGLIHEKTQGILESRDIMYQILHLTETA